jgi:hypothetical protein
MLLTGLECPVSKLANSDTRARPTTAPTALGHRRRQEPDELGALPPPPPPRDSVLQEPFLGPRNIYHCPTVNPYGKYVCPDNNPGGRNRAHRGPATAFGRTSTSRARRSSCG